MEDKELAREEKVKSNKQGRFLCVWPKKEDLRHGMKGIGCWVCMPIKDCQSVGNVD